MKKLVLISIAFSTCYSFSQNLEFNSAIRYDATGDISPEFIRSDSSSNVYVYGRFFDQVDLDPTAGVNTQTTTDPSGRSFLQKLSPAGTVLWTIVDVVAVNNVQVNDMEVNKAGRVYLVGGFSGTVDFDPGSATTSRTAVTPEDPFVCRFNTDGSFGSATNLGAIGDRMTVVELAIDKDNNFIFASRGASTTGSSTWGFVNLFKLSATGTIVFDHMLQGPGYCDVNGLTTDKDNNVILAGKFQRTIDFDETAGTYNLSTFNNNDWDSYVLKYSALGVRTWLNHEPASYDYLRGRKIVTDSTGNVYEVGSASLALIFGGTYTPAPIGSNSYQYYTYLRKINSNGSAAWSFFADTIKRNVAANLVLDRNGNVVVSTGRTVKQFSPAGIELNSIHYNNDAFFYGLNSADDGSIYMTGYTINDSVNCDPAATNSLSIGAIGMIIVKYNVSATSTGGGGGTGGGTGGNVSIEEVSSLNFQLYPNPATSSFTVSGLATNNSIELIDMTGKVVATKNATQGEIKIEVNNFNKGVYFVQIKENGVILATKKLIINN